LPEFSSLASDQAKATEFKHPNAAGQVLMSALTGEVGTAARCVLESAGWSEQIEYAAAEIRTWASLLLRLAHRAAALRTDSPSCS
jgi:hypothetical protein